jgi:hypothetical protein
MLKTLEIRENKRGISSLLNPTKLKTWEQGHESRFKPLILTQIMHWNLVMRIEGAIKSSAFSVLA